MDAEPSMATTPPDPARERGSRWWACAVGLAILPIVLAVAGYFRPVLHGEPIRRMWLDVPFAAYQLAHASELGGRWWTIADDDRIGFPYQTEAAKNPSLFEGLDLMLLATIAGAVVSMSPERHYDLAVIAVLAINGWIAAWLVRRQTRSWFWAAVAVWLITLNFPTGWRILGGHNQIIKYGWGLVAVAAFSSSVRGPGVKRGVVLGLAVAWQLQGSFYQGFLIGLGLGCWWAGAAVMGKLGRRHVEGAIAAALAFGLAAAVFTFPVWTVGKSAFLADCFFQRTHRDVWTYGSDLWQYVVPPDSMAGFRYVNQVGHKPFSAHFEGWAFPGYSVLLAIAAYVIARGRGWRPAVADPRALDLWLGLAAVFVGLSLTGGPSFYLFAVFPTFRCYGRAGLLAMALGCVAAPVIGHALIGGLRSRWLRILLSAAVLALAATDGYRAVRSIPNGGPDSPAVPYWADWLNRAPSGTRLMAFRTGAAVPGQGSPWSNGAYQNRPEAGKAILNGAEILLLESDLALLGASYDRPNPAALKFIAELGYGTLAFDGGYLASNPWIRNLPWLRPVAAGNGWSIFQAEGAFDSRAIAERPMLDHLRTEPIEVPPNCWITGNLELTRRIVVRHAGRVFATWRNSEGRRLGPPRPALFQHVFGPDLPAYSVLSPARPGRYQLVFLDAGGRQLGTIPYVVNPALKPLVLPVDELPAGVTVRVVGPRPGGTTRIVVENGSSFFLQAHSNRWLLYPSLRLHPGFGPASPGSLTLRAGLGSAATLLLPRDLAAGDRLEIDVPDDRYMGDASAILAAMAPSFGLEPDKSAAVAGRAYPADRIQR